MAVTHRAILVFHTNQNSTIRLSIPRANINKTSDNVRQSMEALVSGGVVRSTNGTANDIKSAEIITTERTPIVAPN
jgi:hypothetical protein